MENGLEMGTGMEKGRKRQLTIVLYLLMLAQALVTTIIGPLVSVFIEEYSISLSQNGLIPLMQGLGGVVSVLYGMMFSDSIKKSKLITIFFALYTVSMVAVSFSKTYALLVVLFFVIGASTKMIDAMLNAYVAELHQENRTLYLNLLHAFFGVGALTGSIVSGAFVSAEVRWPWIFITLGVFCCVLLAAFVLVNRKHPEVEAKSSSKVNFADVREIIKQKKIFVLAVLCLLYAGFYISISTWMPTYMQTFSGTGVMLAGITVSAFWVGVIVGRLISPLLTKKIGSKKLILSNCLIAGILFIVATAVGNPTLFMVVLVINGFLVGPVVPLCVSTASGLYPSNTGAASSLIFLFTAIGAFLVPWLVGVVAENMGFVAAFILCGLMPLISALLAVSYPKERADDRLAGNGSGREGTVSQ
ncbi:MAG: MFS transporter [Christensenellales bacterium]|jgi:fucose permease